MCTIMDTMFLKRFCLPVDTNLDEIKNNNLRVNKCICGNYFHVSCVFQGKYTSIPEINIYSSSQSKKINILSYGMNKYTDIDGTMPSVHAEIDAILRLPYLHKRKKLVKVNLLVIRFLKSYKLASSKPCFNCIKNMIDIPQKRGYKIEDIYYSEDNDTIVKTNINKLSNEINPHVTSYYRNNRDQYRYNRSL